MSDNDPATPVRPSSDLILAGLLSSARLIAIRGAESHAPVIQALARWTVRGQRLGVIIGDNRFDLYALAQHVRRHGLAPQPILARIELSRAFTCHQIHRRILTLDIARTHGWAALAILGLLDLFYDEDVAYPESRRLLGEILAHLRALAAAGLPVLVTVAPPHKPGRERLLLQVAEQVELYWEWSDAQPRLPEPAQLALPFTDK